MLAKVGGIAPVGSPGCRSRQKMMLLLPALPVIVTTVAQLEHAAVDGRRALISIVGGEHPGSRAVDLQTDGDRGRRLGNDTIEGVGSRSELPTCKTSGEWDSGPLCRSSRHG